MGPCANRQRHRAGPQITRRDSAAHAILGAAMNSLHRIRSTARERGVLLVELWYVSRPLTTVAACVPVLTAALSVAFLIESGFLAGALPAAIRTGLDSPAGSTLLRHLAALSGLYLASQVAESGSELVARVLGDRLDQSVAQRMMVASLRPTSITHLEDADFQDRLKKASDELRGSTAGSAVPAAVNKWKARLPAVASLAILASLRWWLPIVLLPVVVVTVRYWRQRYEEVTTAIFNRGDLLRRAAYVRDLTLRPPTAKEIRIFGLAQWLHDRFHVEWSDAMAPAWRTMRGSKLTFFGFSLAYAACTALPVGLVLRDGFAGDLSLAGVVIFTQATLSAMRLMFVGDWDRVITDGTSILLSARSVEDAARQFAQPVESCNPVSPAAPEHEISIRDLSFQYPGDPRLVLDDLCLTIRAGESVALVGENGVGKTTLLKLLSGLREPTSGLIQVDGTDLRLLDAREWQCRVAPIFQDFQRYMLSARENITFGRPEPRADALEDICRRAGVWELLTQLPLGLETPLSRQLSDGTDLSGGEWQRIALARALFAIEDGARLLILDEPTANLDVRAEAEFINQFLELTEGLTTIVVSHRLSTVRHASRIVVLEAGRIIEDGSHTDLMSGDGRYASLFRLQASRFEAVVSPADALEPSP